MGLKQGCLEVKLSTCEKFWEWCWANLSHRSGTSSPHISPLMQKAAHQSDLVYPHRELSFYNLTLVKSLQDIQSNYITLSLQEIKLQFFSISSQGNTALPTIYVSAEEIKKKPRPLCTNGGVRNESLIQLKYPVTKINEPTDHTLSLLEVSFNLIESLIGGISRNVKEGGKQAV